MNETEFNAAMLHHLGDMTQDETFRRAAAVLLARSGSYEPESRAALVAVMERAKLPEGDALMPGTSRKISEALQDCGIIKHVSKGCAVTTIKAGNRYRLRRPVDRFPDFLLPVGTTGVVTYVDDQGIVMSVDENCREPMESSGWTECHWHTSHYDYQDGELSYAAEFLRDCEPV